MPRGRLKAASPRIQTLELRRILPTAGQAIQHQSQARDLARAAARPSRKWYGSYRWQQLRARHLACSPLCVYCKRQGRVAQATVCDHVTPHNDDETAFWSGPFQSLCKDCHDSAKKAEENAGRRL
ncbi:HNH endonuclease [Hydrocarboniphaga effusa]|uniref:HNH endonuclease n=1 Tax=Hydrocarboniphaga effusa TaxID=243629 RepID=UPI00398C1E8D